jgi:hypothetical protein
MITCPLCEKKSVAFCRDIVRTYYTVVDKQGLIKVRDKVISNNELDNCWLECNDCHSTSEDSEELNELFENIDWA